jgi:hypothetical protein
MCRMTTDELRETVIAQVGVDARSIDISSTGEETILRRGAAEVKASNSIAVLGAELLLTQVDVAGCEDEGPNLVLVFGSFVDFRRFFGILFREELNHPILREEIARRYATAYQWEYTLVPFHRSQENQLGRPDRDADAVVSVRIPIDERHWIAQRLRSFRLSSMFIEMATSE